MANPFFKFKQFTVFHDRCAMKVGTDGVLLGAWCAIPPIGNALDVGAGSGLIALMIAQRSTNLHIDAVEMDEQAFQQACENVSQSSFARRISLQHADLLAFQSRKQYDLIVSNPPFFESSLLSPSESRSTARHSFSLPPERLLSHAFSLLAHDGKICLIYPHEMLETLLKTANEVGLFASRICHVHSKPHVPPKRVLLEFTRDKSLETKENKLIIELERHIYSPEFRELTSNFYL